MVPDVRLAAITARLERCESSDHRDHDESAEPIEAKDPIDSTEPAQPTEPIDRIDPTDPIESRDPFEPIERNERSDHNDRRDVERGRVCSDARRHGRAAPRRTGTAGHARWCGWSDLRKVGEHGDRTFGPLIAITLPAGSRHADL